MEAHDETQDQPQTPETPSEEPQTIERRTVTTGEINTLTPEAGEDVGEGQVQEQIDFENDQGFRGAKVDPTPNENYAAVNSTATNDLPTPETDEDLRQEARAGRHVDGPSPL